MLVSKILLFGAFFAGGALVGVPSEEGSASETNTFAQSFYEYNGPDYSMSSIQNIANYSRSSNSTQCSGATNVCGVLLPTDTGLGNPPTQADFDAVKAELWDAQQNPSSPHTDVVLQP